MIRILAMRCQMEGTDKNANSPFTNPLTKSGKKVLTSMEGQYGKKKGKQVFYASINKKKKGTKSWHR